MQDIYVFVYDTFNLFIDNLDIKYNGDKDILKEVILNFLTKDNSKYNKVYLEIIKYYDLDVDLKMIKRIIMLMIASKSYVTSVYDESVGISSKEDIMDEFDNLYLTEVIDKFYHKDEIVLDWLEDYLGYINRPYIFQNQSKLMIIKNGLLNNLLKINPFEVLNLADYIKEDAYLKSEIAIQNFFNLYDASLLDLCESEEVENDDALLELFIDKLSDTNLNERELIQYVIANIYETLSIAKIDGNSDFLDYLPLIKVIEENSIDKVIDCFFSDSSFASFIFDAFVTCNDCLIEGDLILKRDTFKEIGNVGLLKRINPYYQEEELVFKKMREVN